MKIFQSLKSVGERVRAMKNARSKRRTELMATDFWVSWFLFYRAQFFLALLFDRFDPCSLTCIFIATHNLYCTFLRIEYDQMMCSSCSLALYQNCVGIEWTMRLCWGLAVRTLCLTELKCQIYSNVGSGCFLWNENNSAFHQYWISTRVICMHEQRDTLTHAMKPVFGSPIYGTIEKKFFSRYSKCKRKLCVASHARNLDFTAMEAVGIIRNVFIHWLKCFSWLVWLRNSCEWWRSAHPIDQKILDCKKI